MSARALRKSSRITSARASKGVRRACASTGIARACASTGIARGCRGGGKVLRKTGSAQARLMADVGCEVGED